MTQALLATLAKPVPRYTSYPTAPHFHAGVDAAQYEDWLCALADDARVSLYLHLPFCDRLCWFCGCHTKQVNRYDPLVSYLGALGREIDAIGQRVGQRPVTAIHFGGGSPSMLRAEDVVGLAARVRQAFNVVSDVEFSVELDPNDLTTTQFDAWAGAGMTRASIGVQDFAPAVQSAINRLQSFEQTKTVIEAVRSRGVRSVNIDMLYGLPYQTELSVVETAEKVTSLRPDRIALFGYAHVPWVKKHQTMIPEAALPDAEARWAQAEKAAAVLCDAGYRRIGFDHFALPHDAMAEADRAGTLSRNFQGYTADHHDALIGLGASAIGMLPQGYVQNVVTTHEYQRRVLAGKSATEKGVALTDDDRVRGYAIERLLCDFALDFDDLHRRFGALAEPVIAEAVEVALAETDGLVSLKPKRLVVEEKGKAFVRTIAAKFDAYLVDDRARYSRAV